MHHRNLVGLILAASILAGCTLGMQPPVSQDSQQAIATVVAQTMQAAQVPTRTQGTPVVSPGASAVTSTAATLTHTVTVTATSTSSKDKPVLLITGNSNCRKGPGGSFGVLTAFTPGIKLDILAYNADNNYYQVKVPNTQDTCWVWGQFATASGNVANLPTARPATAVPAAVPNRPGALTYRYECSGSTITVDLGWNDSSNNETGFHVYRGDTLIADLPPNSTSYTDSLSIASGTTLQYAVASYNDAGESAKRTQQFPAC